MTWIAEAITTLIFAGLFFLFLRCLWAVLEWRDERRREKTGNFVVDQYRDVWSLWFGRDKTSRRVLNSFLVFIFAALTLVAVVKGLPALLLDMGVN